DALLAVHERDARRRAHADQRDLLDPAAVGIARLEPERLEARAQVVDGQLLPGGPRTAPAVAVRAQLGDVRAQLGLADAARARGEVVRGFVQRRAAGTGENGEREQ